MRINPTLMPKVHLSHKDKGYGFDKLDQRYDAMEKHPLMISAELITPYIPAESHNNIHFDGILSQAVLTAHPCAARFDGQACIMPLPIEVLWQSPQGVPLWATSDMLPDDIVQAREYWHKRYPSHRSDFGSKMNAVTTAGRWKEYRVPLNSVRSKTMRCIAIGNRDEVSRLLGFVSHIGKKGSAGYGRVAQWQGDIFDPSDPIGLVLAAKSVPVDYAQIKEISGKYSPLCGWTPPYWYAPYHSPCIVTSCQP